ncbi:unnamed protein product, partial [Rotaria sp. Silwood1]
KEDQIYQHLLPIENGIYDGTVNEKFLREGQGTYSFNNGEEYYSGEWKDDKPDGYGYNFKNYGSMIFHGQFKNGILKEGYGKVQLSNKYQYEGKIKDGKFHGLGCLSIEVSGLTEINESSVQKKILKLVAEWKEDETELIYLNEIEQYYQHQYKDFQDSLESLILLSNENHQQQRQYLQILIDLFEKHLVDFYLLNEIVTNQNLPHKLKSSADLLSKLDHSYTNLNKYTHTETKKSYNDCINHICQQGLKNYIARLTWIEDENKIDCISSKMIFENTLNDFLTKTNLSELKSILYFNPLVIDLIKKLIRFANERILQIPVQYRTQFIHHHKTFLQNLWKNYFQNIDYKSISERFDYENDEKYHFYSDCYSNLLNLSILKEFEFEIHSKRLKNECSIVIKRNGETVYQKILNDKELCLRIIVFDGEDGKKKAERVFIISEEINWVYCFQGIDDNNIIVSILSNNTSKSLPYSTESFFKQLGSGEIGSLEKDMICVSLIRRKDKKIYEKKISSNITEQSLIKDNFYLKLNENMHQTDIESIIYEVMEFVLLNFKPWMNTETKDLSNYLNQSLREDISIKEIEDQLLIKILQDSKKYILQIRSKDSEYVSRSLESIIDYYQESLLKDKYLNYQSKMKDIKIIFNYFIQISINDNSQIRAMTQLQLESIQEFIEGKQILTEMIDHFLNINIEFLKLSQIFQRDFSSDIHAEFHDNAVKILSLTTDIFKLIFQKEIIIQPISCSDILNKYKTSDLNVALRKAVAEENIDDVKVLLELGVDINEQGHDSKKTALHWAVIKENKHLISLLLEKGANIQIKDKNQQSPVDYAEKHGIDLNHIQNHRKESQNKFENKLFALQKINNFLTNLSSLDFSWFVEHTQIVDFDCVLFEKIGENEIYKVLNIGEAKKKVNQPCPHYVLDVIIDLLEIIKNFKIISRASPLEMVKLRAKLIMAIGKSFKYFNDQRKCNSLERFKESCIVPFRNLTVDNESYEIFCDRLEKIDLYFLYNRKLKEITLDQALKLFRDRNKNLFKSEEKIRNAFKMYEDTFQEYLDEINKKKTIKPIIEKTINLAKESIFQREKIPKIIAGLSIVLSLRASDFLEKHQNEYVLKEKYNENLFLQPHCIQILGVLILLDIKGITDSSPPNHLGEILTGQGKSWALALLAGFFSLVGYQVTVGCYSDYLSHRDENDFKKNLEPFYFQNSVQYRTFEQICNEKLSNKKTKKTLRDIVSDIISGKELSPINIKDSKKEKSILLIDEVDVFFSHQFGEMYYPVVAIKNKNIAQLQKDIWKYLMTEKPDQTRLKDFTDRKILSLVDKDQMLRNLERSNTLKDHTKEMIDTAIEIYNDINEKNIFQEKYKIIDNIIYGKDSDGKFFPDTIWGYQNSFYYLKLMYEKQKSFQGVNLNENNFGYILIICGYISYSEIPNSFDRVFGVSGSLKDLSDAENNLLKHYHIYEKSYYPSFFGMSKLKFDRINSFTIKDCKKIWFDSIVSFTRKIIAEERSILIFFENEKLLDEFYASYSGDLGVMPFFITQNKTFDGKEVKHYNDSNVNKLIQDEYAGHHGKVTLLTREFGRGVDFQTEAKVNEKGGTHVIQTFFSEDIKEEIQIKGRTARKDESGSYQLILCLEHLQEAESTYETMKREKKRTCKTNS